MKKEKKLKLGLPKGSLQEATLKIFEKAGFRITTNGRSYKPPVDDEEIECLLVRAQEMPVYVERGVLDVGLTGKDWIVENDADVVEVANLVYGKRGLKPVKIVLAVPKDSKIKSVKDLEGKRIATEYINITKRYLKKSGVKAEVEFSWGATEIKAPSLVDAIVELTETGTTLNENNLKIINTIMESTTRVIVNKESLQDPWKAGKINQMTLLLRGVMEAEKKVGVMMNVRKKDLSKVLKILPALQNPTISELSDKKWVDVLTVMDEKLVKELLPGLKEKGAEGIVEFPLNKVID